MVPTTHFKNLLNISQPGRKEAVPRHTPSLLPNLITHPLGYHSNPAKPGRPGNEFQQPPSFEYIIDIALSHGSAADTHVARYMIQVEVFQAHSCGARVRFVPEPTKRRP